MNKDPYIRQEREQVQHRQPGLERCMREKPVFIRDDYRGSGKLTDKVALITGGDSGIGRAVAVHFAREGADICLVYLDESQDADDTCALVRQEGRRCSLFQGDVGNFTFCRQLADEVLDKFDHLDILVNNAAEQHPQESLADISEQQLLATFQTNIFGYFHMMKACLPKLAQGGRIINTSSVTAHRGSHHLVDYAGTKGAIEAITRSVAQQVAERGITVNCVAPGPIWTPLIPATFDQDALHDFGGNTLLGRPGQPCEVATCFVFLASTDGDYMTGQTLHPNGGGYLSS